MSRPEGWRPLPTETVQRARWLMARGETDAVLADAIGVPTGVMYRIRVRRTYADVPDPSWSADWLLDEAREVDEPVFASEQERRWSARMARRRARWLERAASAPGGLP